MTPPTTLPTKDQRCVMSLGGGLRVADSPVGVEVGGEAVVSVERRSGEMCGVVYDHTSVPVSFKSQAGDE